MMEIGTRTFQAAPPLSRPVLLPGLEGHHHHLEDRAPQQRSVRARTLPPGTSATQAGPRHADVLAGLGRLAADFERLAGQPVAPGHRLLPPAPAAAVPAATAALRRLPGEVGCAPSAQFLARLDAAADDVFALTAKLSTLGPPKPRQLEVPLAMPPVGAGPMPSPAAPAHDAPVEVVPAAAKEQSTADMQPPALAKAAKELPDSDLSSRARQVRQGQLRQVDSEAAQRGRSRNSPKIVTCSSRRPSLDIHITKVLQLQEAPASPKFVTRSQVWGKERRKLGRQASPSPEQDCSAEAIRERVERKLAELFGGFPSNYRPTGGRRSV